MKAAIVVEFDIDAPDGFNEVARPLMEALRVAAPPGATQLHACIKEPAERVVAAATGKD
ncbi:hypothetical protein [Amycolatopsis suaedae]|uniref:hypothetical protein n=1 Tax=Amycolatopsis suaedae TaxID=2510978 RepID=UPI0013EF5569|nr:hypothetical protein [Amycolatopsis suaedae]